MVREGYKQTEIGTIPEDWDVMKIENVLSEISMGPFGSDIKVSNFINRGVPVLSGANLRRHYLEDGFKNFVSKQKAISLKKAVAKRGDIVVTHRGTIGQIAYIPENSKFDKYVISQSQFRATFDDTLLPEWVALYFKSDLGSKKLLEGKGHTGVPAIAQATTTFRKLSIPRPRVEEQKAIAEALSDVDALIESLEKLLAKKSAIKTATMQELLTGKTRLPRFDGDWENKKISSLATPNRGASPRPIDSPKWFDRNSPVGWVRISDVTKSGKYLLETTQKLSAAGIENSRFVPKNTLIMSICATVGRPIITKIDVCIHDGFVVFNDLVCNRDYLFHYLKFLENTWGNAGQTGSQMNLNTGIINAAKIALPICKEEQNAIAVVLSDLDAIISEDLERLERIRQIRRGMMQELLTGRTRLV